MSEPKVSIIIPAFFAENYLDQAIDSALAQTWPNTEIIVVNDGSRDAGNTERIALSYGDAIRYIAKENGGTASALNAGIRAMTGDVFCWLSHDDIHLPEKTTRQVEEWTRLGRPNGMIYSDYRSIDAAGSPLYEFRVDHAMVEANPLYSVLKMQINGCTAFIPRAVFEEVGLFDESLPSTQDYDLWWRMVRRVPFHHIPEILVEQRLHAGQGSRRSEATIEAEAFWIRTVDSVTSEERLGMEGSSARFYQGMEQSLSWGFSMASANARMRKEQDLAAILISILVIGCDDRHAVAATLASLASGSHNRVEALLVGTSGDSVNELVRDLSDSIVVPVRGVQTPDLGEWRAISAGWKAAQGALLAFARAGDQFDPRKLGIACETLECGGARAVRSGYLVQTKAGDTRMVPVYPAGQPPVAEPMPVEPSTLVVRRDQLDAWSRILDADVLQDGDLAGLLDSVVRLPLATVPRAEITDAETALSSEYRRIASLK